MVRESAGEQPNPTSAILYENPLADVIRGRRFSTSRRLGVGRVHLGEIWVENRGGNKEVFCEVSDGKSRCPSACVIDPAL